jgi:putative membrane protein
VTRFLTMAALIALPMTAVSAQAPLAPATFVAKAGASDLYEKQSSQLVLATTANPKIKGFAQMMITDHSKSTAEVKRAATAAHVKVAPPRLDADGLKNVAALRAAKGRARDTLYVQQQKVAHQKALALHQGYASNGTVPSLRTVAAGIAPVVQTHISELHGM